jgi:hypothetical protein
VVVRVYAGLAWPTGEAGDLTPVAKPARVVQEVADGDGSLVLRQLGNVFPDVVLEIELPVEREEDCRGGGELLRDRAGLEDRRRLVRDVVLEIRLPERARVARLAGAVDANGASGTGGRVPPGEDGPGERREVARRRLSR